MLRREFCGLVAAGAGLSLGCRRVNSGSSGQAALSARPGDPSGNITAGTIRLGSGDPHDGYLYVPASYRPESPMPLVLALHGASGDVSGPLALLGPYAEAQGFLIVAVNSSDYSWDGVIGSYGPDVARIDTALRRAFERCRVDAARLVIEGFSDGASYALGLGLANGDLFTRIVAFSPGFLHESATGRRGRPELFISHGRQDTVLPIEAASRQIVPRLQTEGYAVSYVEFEGGHGVPPEIARRAVSWLLR
jgi:phospholipase/carboxylesterase